MPIINGYSQDYAYINITDDNLLNNVTYRYTSYDDYEIPKDLILKIKGNSETYGYILSFSDNYTKAHLSFGGAKIGANSGSYVKIMDKDENVLSFEEAKYNSSGGAAVFDENGPYFNFKKEAFDLDLEIGTIIEVKRPIFSNRVFFFTSYNNTNSVSDAISGFETTGEVTRYIVEDGYLRREDMTSDEAKDALYNILKVKIKEIIDNYIENTSEEVISNRYSDFKNKSIVMAAYSKLRSNDKLEYNDFISNLAVGGKPVLKLIGNTIYNVNESIDLLSLISATDNEDGNLIISNDNTKIVTNLDSTKKGVYSVNYKVSDNDGNTSTLDINITIKEVEALVKENDDKVSIKEEVKVSPKTEEEKPEEVIKTEEVIPNGALVKEENTTINEEITTTVKNDIITSENKKNKKKTFNFIPFIVTFLIIVIIVIIFYFIARLFL
jgi:hypothetical protein